VGRKLERAVQAKVRDSKKKTTTTKEKERKAKRKAWLVKRSHERALRVGSEMANFARFLINRLYPQGMFTSSINYYFISGFTPTVTWFLSSVTIFKEVCRVFVLRRGSDFHLSRPVLSLQVIYSHIHSYICTNKHTLTHSCIHTYIHAHTYIRKIIYT